MATKVQEYSATPSSNSNVNGTNIAEGCAPAGINDAIRGVMAHIAAALSGSDDSIMTGTAGANGRIAAFNADGDLVAAGTVTGTLDFSGATVTGLSATIADGDYGDITVSSGVWSIDAGAVGTPELADSAVTLAKMADMATDSLLGRDTAGTGAPEVLTPAQVRTILNVEDGATAGGGAMVFLASVDASADAAIAFTQFDGATYDAYKVIISNLVPSVTSSLLLRTSTDGGSTYDSGVSHYAWSYEQTSMSTSPGQTAAGDDADDNIAVTGTANVITGDGVSLEMTILGPHLARNTQVIWDGIYEGASFARINGAGVRNSSADVDAIQFRFGSGNIASGTITLYGLKNS